MDKKTLLKLGRFAFLLPYLIMPLLFLMEGTDIGSGFAAALLCTFVLFAALESPIVLIYPICWIISVFCFIRYGKLLKAEQEQTEDPQQREQLEEEQLDSKGCFQIFIFLGVFLLIIVIAFLAVFHL